MQNERATLMKKKLAISSSTCSSSSLGSRIGSKNEYPVIIVVTAAKAKKDPLLKIKVKYDT